MIMINDELKNKLETTITSLLEKYDLELIEFNMKRQGKTLRLEVITDKPEGGITIDECVRLNKSIDKKIEERQWIDDYIVEVSSPGMDRPLKTQKDFLRAIGRNVRFHLSELIENKVEYVGIVEAVEGDHVVVQTKADSIDIPISKIHKAMQVI